MERSPFCAVLASILLAAVVGCTSVSTTYFHRDDEDGSWKKNHLKGIPITLEVPTHLRFNVIERYWMTSTGLLRNGDGDHVLVSRVIDYVPITEKKVFTVDFKRPAAGPYTLNATIDPSTQYFSDVKHTLTDNTIEVVGKQVNTLLGKLLPAGIGTATSSTPPTGDLKLTPVDSIVCSRVFKIDDPHFELQLAQFLEENCGAPVGILVGTAAARSEDKSIGTISGAGTSPGGAGTSPGGAGTSPGGAGTSPGGAGTSPGGAGTSPGAATPKSSASISVNPRNRSLSRTGLVTGSGSGLRTLQGIPTPLTTSEAGLR